MTAERSAGKAQRGVIVCGINRPLRRVAERLFKVASGPDFAAGFIE